MSCYKKVSSLNKEITLASIRLSDAEEYLAWKRNSSLENKIVFSTYGQSRVIETVKEAEDELNKLAVENAFAIFDSQDKWVGLIGFENTIAGNQRSEIWVQMNPQIDIEKQIHYGKEALHTMIEYAYEVMNLNNLMVSVPAFHKQAIEILKKSKMELLGQRTASKLGPDDHLHDTVIYQTTQKMYYNHYKEKQDEIQNNGIIVPSTIPISELREFIPGQGIDLIKYNGNEDYVSTMAHYLSDLSIALPLGQAKVNWNDYRARNLLKNVSYLIMKDHQLLGYVNLYRINKENRTAESEVMIGDLKYHNKGYGTQALKLLLEEAFLCGYHNISSNVFGFNQASLAMNEKIGRTPIGIRKECYFAKGNLHDMHMLEITADEFSKIKR